MTMLNKHDDGRSRVTGITHDRAPSHDGGSVVGFILTNGKLHETERAVGKWKIPYGKGGNWCVFIFGVPNVVAPA
jgi:hypothetical protein